MTPRILHLPTPVGNHGYSLACAERRKGLNSKSLIVGQNPFGFIADLNISQGPGIIGKIAYLLRKYRESERIIKNYDILHYNFSESLIHHPKFLLKYWDLKRVPDSLVKIATHNGSDVRDERAFQTNPFSPYHDRVLYPTSNFEKRRKLNRTFHEYMDHIFVLNPDLLRCVPREKATFLPYIKEAWYNRPQKREIFQNRIIKVVHAPTNRAVKGTDSIEMAIARLKSEGFAINLILIEGVPHNEALKIYNEADIVIDQLRVGWYGGFAIEVARLCKPVITYIHDDYLDEIPDPGFSDGVKDSFIVANPDTIYDQLKKCLNDHGYCRAKAEALYSFVEKEHNPDVVISKVISVYEKLLSGLKL